MPTDRDKLSERRVLNKAFDEAKDGLKSLLKDGAGNDLASTDEGGGVRSLNVSLKSGDIEYSTLVGAEKKSQAIGVASVNIPFSQDVFEIEIINNDDDAIIYVAENGGTALVASDIPVYPREYYRISRKVIIATGISIISDTAATDVRIIGRY